MIIAIIGAAIGAGLLSILVLAVGLGISAAFWGWLFMLAEGSMADHHILFAHPLGYGVCFLIGIPISLVLG